MITFEINGVGYATHFNHFTKPEELEPGCAGVTECMVTRLADGTQVMWAEAKARRPDNFCRSLGRRISFGRCLAVMTQDRAVAKGLVKRVK